MTDFSAENELYLDSELSPLEIKSYCLKYINILYNKVGVVISIPENQPEITYGDEWSIYYSFSSKGNIEDNKILIGKGTIEGSPHNYKSPTIKTSSDFFPKTVDKSIYLFYVIKTKKNKKIMSPFNKQILSTKQISSKN